MADDIIKKFHPHPLSCLVFYLSGIIFMILSFFFSRPLFAIGFLAFILGEVVRRAETFYILDSGVARVYKLLSTSREFTEYEKIQNLEVSQSFIDNILGIGNIKIDTAGGDKTEVNFYGVGNPYYIEKIIREKMTLK